MLRRWCSSRILRLRGPLIEEVLPRSEDATVGEGAVASTDGDFRLPSTDSVAVFDCDVLLGDADLDFALSSWRSPFETRLCPFLSAFLRSTERLAWAATSLCFLE